MGIAWEETIMSGFVPLSRWVGERAAVATMAPTLKRLIEATQGQELLVAGTASTGPPLIVFWGPFVVGFLMLFGADRVPALGPAGLAIAGVGALLGLFLFKPVSVALSDRHLIVFRDTSIRPRRIKGILLDAPRNDVFVQGVQVRCWLGDARPGLPRQRRPRPNATDRPDERRQGSARRPDASRIKGTGQREVACP
jgi:hypothetical protein